ncbi:retrovirus-related pol polyprotein from transposon TNT 1-94, partial [Tanacetum coccineum]
MEPKLYDGNVIKNTSDIVILDSEKTLMLAKESRSKMLLEQKDPMMLEKKVNTTPVNYVILNQLSQDFEPQFVPQTELSAEQAFWFQNSMNSPDPTLSSRPTKVEVPKELPKVSMVNTSLKKLKHHLAGFEVVVKERTTAIAITEGSWGFEHTKACFRDEIIPFVKALKDLFNTFDLYLIDELFEVQNIFHQMEQAIGNVTISRVYYVEGLGHNLFFVGKFCDSNLEVAFRQHTYFIRIPKLKFEKDHLCSVCAMGKSKKKPHKPKSEDTNQEKLYLLHIDLCGPISVARVNGKKYILIIVDDYSRFTWV